MTHLILQEKGVTMGEKRVQQVFPSHLRLGFKSSIEWNALHGHQSREKGREHRTNGERGLASTAGVAIRRGGRGRGSLRNLDAVAGTGRDYRGSDTGGVSSKRSGVDGRSSRRGRAGSPGRPGGVGRPRS